MALQHVPGKNMGDLKLFALSTCPWCRKTKQLLDELGVEYNFVDVDLLPANENYHNDDCPEMEPGWIFSSAGDQ